MKKIMGFEKFRSKKGTECCAVSVEEEFANRENVSSCGIKCSTVMIYGDSCSAITKDAIGKTLGGFFGYSNGVCMVQNPVVE